MERVLIVEDDPPLRLAMTKALRAAGYEVATAKAGDEGLEAALADPPDCVLLDVMMPGMNGYEVLAELRKHDPDLPIVMITAKGEEADKVRGLSLGADEYVVKPVGLAELQARVGAALRRRRLTTKQAPVQMGVLLVDFQNHSATRDGVAVEVTAHEMKLLEFFMRNEGGSFRAPAFSRRCGAPTISGPIAPSTTSSIGFARRSSSIRRSPCTSSRCAARAIGSSADAGAPRIADEHTFFRLQ